jgi:hypothetical protein
MEKMVYISYNECRKWQSNTNMETMQMLLTLMYLKIRNKTIPRPNMKIQEEQTMNTRDTWGWEQKVSPYLLRTRHSIICFLFCFQVVSYIQNISDDKRTHMSLCSTFLSSLLIYLEKIMRCLKIYICVSSIWMRSISNCQIGFTSVTNLFLSFPKKDIHIRTKEITKNQHQLHRE